MTNWTEVYRYEDLSGVGVFRNGTVYDYINASWLDGNGSNPYDMPAPDDKRENASAVSQHVRKMRKGFSHIEEVFGFGSVQDLVLAFSCRVGRAALHKNQCYLTVYRVPEEHVIRGHFQVMFKKTRAQRIRILSPSLRTNWQLTVRHCSVIHIE